MLVALCWTTALSGQAGPLRPVLPEDSVLVAREKELLDKASEDAGPLGYAELASFYFELAVPWDLPPATKAARIAQGVAAADRALARDAGSAAARTSKAGLRQMQADMEPDPAARMALIKDAEALLGMAPMPPDYEALFMRLMPRRPDAASPIPVKVQDARPDYPPIAQSARVQGTVVLEMIVDEAGRVAAVRVLRSIPLLDAAAVAAAQHWRFKPWIVNGRPMPVLMPAMVTFSLK